MDKEQKEEIDLSAQLCRKKCEDLIDNIKNCLENRNFDNFDTFFDPKSVLNRCNEEVIGRNKIRSFIQEHYHNQDIKLFKQRLLIDSNQRHIAVEWITRQRELGNENAGYYQGMASWYIKLSPNDISIKTWYIWIDKVFNEQVPSLNTPLPVETWKPMPIQMQYTRHDISEFVRKRMEMFEQEDIEQWRDSIHDDVIIRPPWDTLVGKNCCVDGAQKFFSKFQDHSISKIELLFDETCPNWVVYIQLFSTTNRETGKRGQDFDFIFNEIIDGKVRYWRSYFNANYSSEFTENNFKFFIDTISKCCKNEKNLHSSFQLTDKQKQLQQQRKLQQQTQQGQPSSSSTTSTTSTSNIIGSGKD